jgi:hypothetical protein
VIECACDHLRETATRNHFFGEVGQMERAVAQAYGPHSRIKPDFRKAEGISKAAWLLGHLQPRVAGDDHAAFVQDDRLLELELFQAGSHGLGRLVVDAGIVPLGVQLVDASHFNLLEILLLCLRDSWKRSAPELHVLLA